MSQMSDYLEAALVNHLFRGTALAAPASLQIGLFTTAPGDAGGGVEVSGNGYTRATVTTGTAAFSAATAAGQTANSAAVAFPTPTGSGWGVVNSFGIFDASGTNLLFWGSLGTPKTINAGDTVSFAAGSLTVTFA